MTPAQIEDVLRRLEVAVSLRGNWNRTFQDIGDRILPQSADFEVQRSDGEDRTELMFDATAALALQKYVAAIESFATPRNQVWHGLTVTDKSLAKKQRVKAYMDEWRDILFRVRYSPRSAFASQSNEAYLSHGAFGTGGLYIDDDIKARCIRYKSLNLAQTYILENYHGLVDTVFRRFKRTYRQIEQKWPGKMPPRMAEAMKKTPDEKVEVVHYVGPRTDYDPGRMGPKSMPWVSCYILPADKAELEEGGYRTWPFGIARYMTNADEVYGRSPAWLVLSNIKVLNEMKKTHLKAGHRVVDPPLLASEDGILQAFSMAPGALNYGGLDAQGNQLVKPLMTGARLDIGLDMMDREREIIGTAFLADVYRALVENPQMTATQTMQLISERAVLVAPVLGRLQAEFLGNTIEREIDILTEAGEGPEMPPELVEAGGEYRIEYTSPMSRAMRASEGVAIQRTLESLTPLAQIDPGALDIINIPEAGRVLAEINGVPASLIRDEEAIAAMQAGRAQDQQAQQLLAAAPSVTSAAANLIKLQANSGVPVL
jgi:hypothetical protein